MAKWSLGPCPARKLPETLRTLSLFAPPSVLWEPVGFWRVALGDTLAF